LWKCNFALKISKLTFVFIQHKKLSSHTIWGPRKRIWRRKKWKPILSILSKKKQKKHFIWLEYYYFCELGTHAKFHDPWMMPSGRIVTVGTEREKKNIKKHGLPKLLCWLHTLCSDQNLIYAIYVIIISLFRTPVYVVSLETSLCLNNVLLTNRTEILQKPLN
jgi:hypothetical protein